MYESMVYLSQWDILKKFYVWSCPNPRTLPHWALPPPVGVPGGSSDVVAPLTGYVDPWVETHANRSRELLEVVPLGYEWDAVTQGPV